MMLFNGADAQLHKLLECAKSSSVRPLFCHYEVNRQVKFVIDGFVAQIVKKAA